MKKLNKKPPYSESDILRWLLKKGIAWRGCYNESWQEGEWLYGFLKAREYITKEMKKEYELKKSKEKP